MKNTYFVSIAVNKLIYNSRFITVDLTDKETESEIREAIIQAIADSCQAKFYDVEIMSISFICSK